MFEARNLADDLAIARPSFSSMVPSPLGSMRRISASCVGVRVLASRWIEVAALMLPVCGKGWEGRESPGCGQSCWAPGSLKYASLRLRLRLRLWGWS